MIEEIRKKICTRKKAVIVPLHRASQVLIPYGTPALRFSMVYHAWVIQVSKSAGGKMNTVRTVTLT